MSVLGSTFQYDPFQLIIYQFYIAVTSALTLLLGSHKDEPTDCKFFKGNLSCAHAQFVLTDYSSGSTLSNL